MTDKDELWLKISNTFKQEMSDLNFNTWIAPLKPLYLTNTEFILLSPNRFTKKQSITNTTTISKNTWISSVMSREK